MVDDDTDLKDSVQRLHRFVVDTVRTKRGDPFASPVTVSEIYQELAPYRAVRSALGFEMNADYEHALVRMLSGIDGLTRMEPSKARERLRKELDSPNPDVTLYRDYAACDVVLNPPNPQADWVREQLEEDMNAAALPAEDVTPAVPSSPRSHHAPDWSALAALSGSEHLEEEAQAEDVEKSSPDETDDTWTDTPDAQADADPELEAYSESETDDDMEMNETPPSRIARVSACGFCDSTLPANRQLRYCPFCGADQSLQPCGSCGEPLEPDWVFCIACGTPIASEE